MDSSRTYVLVNFVYSSQSTVSKVYFKFYLSVDGRVLLEYAQGILENFDQ